MDARTRVARTQAWIDQQKARLATTIRRYGWSIQYVGGSLCWAPGCSCPPGDGLPFAYTIGLFGLRHPELLIFGVPPDIAATVLNDVGNRIRSGESLLPGRVITFADWPHSIIPEKVPNPGEIVFGANDFYSRPAKHSVPVLQLSYDDASGRFPWDKGYIAPDLQPRPGTFRA